MFKKKLTYFITDVHTELLDRLLPYMYINVPFSLVELDNEIKEKQGYENLKLTGDMINQTDFYRDIRNTLVINGLANPISGTEKISISSYEGIKLLKLGSWEKFDRWQKGQEKNEKVESWLKRNWFWAEGIKAILTAFAGAMFALNVNTCNKAKSDQQQQTIQESVTYPTTTKQDTQNQKKTFP